MTNHDDADDQALTWLDEDRLHEECGVFGIFGHPDAAALTALGGALLALYVAYANPDTLAGIGVSLRIVFAVVLGGMYSLLGPSVGTALTIALSEYLRIYFGIKLIGIAETIYGLTLILFIIFLPSGIWGSLTGAWRRRRAAAGSARPAAA